jgi:hypothetical protein
MTTPRRFEQDLPALLADLYVAGTPDYRDDIVRRIAATRQRPAWTFPERWIPMDITTQAAPVARMPWRQLVVLALIGVLIALLAVAYVGSQTRLPEPYGLAGNGRVAYAANGDIYTADPVDGSATPIVSGPEVDRDPAFSLDGTRLAFVRELDGLGDQTMLYVAVADGSDPTAVASDPLTGLQWWSFSPDGRELLAVIKVESQPRLAVLTADGSTQPRILDVPLPLDRGTREAPSYRPPDGREILIATKSPGAAQRELLVVDLATGLSRSVVKPPPGYDVFGGAWSPSGQQITYGLFEILGDGPRARLHVVDADGSGDRLVDSTPGTTFVSGQSAWSNDGTRMVLLRGVDGGAREESVVVPTEGDGPTVTLVCGAGQDVACPGDWVWSPDDTALLGAVIENDVVTGYVAADPATGAVTALDWPGDSTMLSWQRRAP